MEAETHQLEKRLSISSSKGLPTNTHREGSLVPVSTSYERHLARHVGARPIENFVRVAMFSGAEFVRV